MTPDSSSSSKILSSFSLFADGNLNWGWMIGFTLSSMISWTWQYLCWWYLCLPISLKMSWKLALMCRNWPSCGRSDIFCRSTLLISAGVRCFAIWLYSRCCTSWMCSVCRSWSSSSDTSILWRLMGTCRLLMFMYGEVKCCVLTHRWLFVMTFSIVYDGFALLPVGRDGRCKLSHEWQQQWTIWFEFCFTWL